MKRSKRYVANLEKLDKNKAYSVEEAVKLVKKTSNSKFDGTVEVAMNLNLDTKKNDQQLRGAVVLPNGTGKSKKILVLAKGDQAKAAKEAGADFVGDVDMIQKIEQESWFDYDVIIATPEMMPLLGKIGKLLGSNTTTDLAFSNLPLISSTTKDFFSNIFAFAIVSFLSYAIIKSLYLRGIKDLLFFYSSVRFSSLTPLLSLA